MFSAIKRFSYLHRQRVLAMMATWLVRFEVFPNFGLKGLVGSVDAVFHADPHVIDAVVRHTICAVLVKQAPDVHLLMHGKNSGK